MTGKLGGLSFYHHKHYGMLVRQCNAVSRDRYRNDPAFERSRENNSELGRTSTNAALLRRGLLGFMHELGTGQLDNLVMSHCCKVRNLDTVSERGKRSVQQALELDPSLLGGLELVKTHALDWFTGHDPSVNVQSCTITLNNYVPQQLPKGATHAGFAGIRLQLDFRNDARDRVEGEVVFVALQDASEGVDIVLDLNDPTLRITEGFEVWGMRIVFYQEVNGELYELHAGAAKLVKSNKIQNQNEEQNHDENEQNQEQNDNQSEQEQNDNQSENEGQDGEQIPPT